MKAVVFKKGEGLQFLNVPDPKPDSDQVLLKVSNTGFCGSDHSLIETAGTPDGIILGHEVSGVVLESGSEVKNIPEGMKVIIRPTCCGKCAGCNMGKPELCSSNRRSIGIGDLPGGFAEYLKVYPQMLIPVPDGVDSQNAALAELFAVGLHAINQTNSNRGSALVIGAGAVGLALVKLLKILNYSPVAVSEPIETKRKLAEQFGADILIDPIQDDLQVMTFQLRGVEGFTSVFECAGLSNTLSAAMDAAGPGGNVCQLSVIYHDILINPVVMMLKELTLFGSYGNTHQENLQCLQWMAEGRLDGRPMISDWCTLEQLLKLYAEKIHSGKTIKAMLTIGNEF
jgi:threonine dehydrogenase-like Zn-dependent dehydrogenase